MAYLVARRKTSPQQRTARQNIFSDSDEPKVRSEFIDHRGSSLRDYGLSSTDTDGERPAAASQRRTPTAFPATTAVAASIDTLDSNLFSEDDMSFQTATIISGAGHEDEAEGDKTEDLLASALLDDIPIPQ